ncbi:ArdC family protein [Rugosimonospora africana]|uniref:N-terminal domain-containing protein n=1 Tax=Rugosimonospora africana TaxID=556532 RepID=A0A8J3VRH0_9ACTN|nr:ArdC-like ssDNA-binding domain-containing protein [Rugosimonospora africana]GIH16122.1 hypothetical protein Raf01_42940 [Rugosimonospora africana]
MATNQRTTRAAKPTKNGKPTRRTTKTETRGRGADDGQEREAFLEKAREDFEQRLAAMAADPAQWIEFVETVAAWGARYSLGNQLLLMMQAAERNVEPQYFLPYGSKDRSTGWLKYGRQVRRDEKSFKVWAPVKRRPSEDEAQEMEAAGRKVRRDPDGRPSVQVVGFRLASTFDLSQTDGEPFQVPTVQYLRRHRQATSTTPRLLEGDDPGDAFDDVVKLIKDAGYGFELAPPGSALLGDANGMTTGGAVMQVRVRDDVSPAQRLKTTVHELAHIRCEHLTSARVGENLHRGRRETEAESVAHIVCAALGVDTASYSDAYVLGWANGDLDLVKACAATVLRVAKTILIDLATGDPDPDDVEEDPTTMPGIPSVDGDLR